MARLILAAVTAVVVMVVGTGPSAWGAQKPSDPNVHEMTDCGSAETGFVSCDEDETTSTTTPDDDGDDYEIVTDCGSSETGFVSCDEDETTSTTTPDDDGEDYEIVTDCGSPKTGFVPCDEDETTSTTTPDDGDDYEIVTDCGSPKTGFVPCDEDETTSTIQQPVTTVKVRSKLSTGSPNRRELPRTGAPLGLLAGGGALSTVAGVVLMRGAGRQTRDSDDPRLIQDDKGATAQSY